MGTPYQVIYSEYAPELKMMDYLGFDATTFGNHEFDYRAAGLADMLNAAGDLDIRMVTANIDWDQTLADEELREDAGRLKEACDAYGAARLYGNRERRHKSSCIRSHGKECGGLCT